MYGGSIAVVPYRYDENKTNSFLHFMIYSALWSKAMFGEETDKCMCIYSLCKHRLHLTLMALQPSTAFGPTGNINYALFLIHRAVYKERGQQVIVKLVVMKQKGYRSTCKLFDRMLVFSVKMLLY